MKGISHSLTDQGKKQEEQGEKGKIKHQCDSNGIGKAVMVNGKPRYIVDTNGRVKVFTQVILRRNNQEVQQTYQSNLNLTKVQTMSEIKILMSKTNSEKRDLLDRFETKIQKLGVQNQQLKDRVSTLQKNQVLASQKIKLLSDIVYRLETEHKSLYDVCENMKKQFKKLTDFVRIDPSPYSSNFSLSQNMITYTGQANSFTQFMIKQIIPLNKTFRFKIKIIRSTSRNIMIGICDYDSQKSARTSYSSGSAFAYYGPGTGYKYPTSQVEGKGVNVGDIVETVVNLSKGSISWNINSTFNCSYADKGILMEPNRKFVPYVQLYQQNQCVEWLGFTIE